MTSSDVTEKIVTHTVFSISRRFEVETAEQKCSCWKIFAFVLGDVELIYVADVHSRRPMYVLFKSAHAFVIFIVPPFKSY